MPTGDALLRAFTQSGAAFAPGQIAGQQAGGTARHVLSTLATIPAARRQRQLDEAKISLIGAKASETAARTALMEPKFEAQKNLQEAYADQARAVAERQRLGTHVDFLEALPAAIAVYNTQPELGSEIINNLAKARGLKTTIEPELFRGIGPAFGTATNSMLEKLSTTSLSDPKALDKLLSDTLLEYGTHPSLLKVSPEMRVAGAQKIITMFKELHALRSSFPTNVGKMNEDQFLSFLALQAHPNEPDKAKEYFIGAKADVSSRAVIKFLQASGLQADTKGFENYEPPIVTIDSEGKVTIKRVPRLPSKGQEDALAQLDFEIAKTNRIMTLFNAGAKDWIGPSLAGRYGTAKLFAYDHMKKLGLSDLDVAFIRALKDLLNQTIVEITGAQMGQEEVPRIMGSVPQVTDPPGAFVASLNITLNNLKVFKAAREARIMGKEAKFFVDKDGQVTILNFTKLAPTPGTPLPKPPLDMPPVGVDIERRLERVR